jgi:3-deoxy-D-manno-octulosonate 8-phosphate phosphatase (KDO 8-P phosphatase)
MPKLSRNLKQKLLKIRLVILDVDGVMTEGRIIFGEKEYLISFDVKDGAGIKYLQRAGIRIAIITGRKSTAVKRRAAELGITDVYQRALRKVQPYEKLLEKYNLKPRHIACVGDDLPDLPVIRRVGVSFAVSNAVQEIKRAADYVTRNPGGCGAIREIAEIILKSQNKWKGLVQRYLE